MRPGISAAHKGPTERWSGGTGKLVLVSKDQSSLLKIVGRHLDRHAIARQSLDPVLLHSPRGVGHDFVAGVELDAKARIRQRFDHKAFKLHEFFFCHYQPFEPYWPTGRCALSRCGSAARCRNATPMMLAGLLWVCFWECLVRAIG